MEKISRIIPSSPRTRAVPQEGQAVRPGAPAFGRPMGKVTPRNFFETKEALAAKEVLAAKEALAIKDTALASEPQAVVSLAPEESLEVKDKVTLSSPKINESQDENPAAIVKTEGSSPAKTDTALYNARGEKTKAQIVDDLSRKFFEGSAKSSMSSKPKVDPLIANPVPKDDLRVELEATSELKETLSS